MIIGYVTDIHIRADTPSGRLDNFNKSLITKLEEVGQIFEDKKCDIILCGGDFGDRPDIPYSVYNDLSRILRYWNKPIIGIIGSHDYYGYEMKSLKRTAVGALFVSGIIELVGGKELPEYIDIGNIVVCGTPHTYWLDDNSKNYYKPKFNKNKIQIQLTHGNLLEHTAVFQHTLIKDITTESDIVLGAHYHPGWKKIYHLNNTDFINPGSLARLDNTGVERIPKVLIIDTTNINNIVYEFVSLKTALSNPFKEKITESKEAISMNLMTKVLDLIKETQVNILNIKEQLPKVAQELGYDNDILNEAFDLIESAEKE